MLKYDNVQLMSSQWLELATVKIQNVIENIASRSGISNISRLQPLLYSLNSFGIVFHA